MEFVFPAWREWGFLTLLQSDACMHQIRKIANSHGQDKARVKIRLFRHALLAFTLVGAFATLAAPSQAAAATGDHAQYQKPSTIRLSVSSGVAATRGAVLKCHPMGGSHKRGAEACTQLDASGGSFEASAQNSGVACTMQYEPVTATAVGQWNGRSVNFEQTYSNSCVLAAHTGAIFDI